jgi:hypothetical protein
VLIELQMLEVAMLLVMLHLTKDINLLLDETFRKFCTSLNLGLLQNRQLEN